MPEPVPGIEIIDGFEVYPIQFGQHRMLQYVGNDRLLHWAENFENIEPETLAWIDSFPENAVLYDLGASIGNFSIYAAVARGATVYAFEPEIQNFSTLGLNHYVNREHITAPFVPVNIALSDKNEIGELHIRKYGAGEHVKIMGQPVLQDTKQEFDASYIQPITCIRLDDAVAFNGYAPPTHVKIDVDGSELQAIEGGRSTLAQPSVRSIMIELSSKGDDLTDAARTLEALGFAERHRNPVVNLRGGYYEDLFNIEFEKIR